MSRTKHHRNQKHTHNGHDYWGKYDCNKLGGTPYGKEGRKLAAKERREVSKDIIKEELDEHWDNDGYTSMEEYVYMLDEFLSDQNYSELRSLLDDYSCSGHLSDEQLCELHEELTDKDKLFPKLVFSDIDRKEAFSTIKESRQKRRVPRRRVKL